MRLRVLPTSIFNGLLALGLCAVIPHTVHAAVRVSASSHHETLEQRHYQPASAQVRLATRLTPQPLPVSHHAPDLAGIASARVGVAPDQVRSFLAVRFALERAKLGSYHHFTTTIPPPRA